MVGSRRRRLLVGVVLALMMAWPATAQAATPPAAPPAAAAATASGSDLASSAAGTGGQQAASRRWSWSTPRQVSTADPAQFAAVSCGSPRSCLAADEGGFYYRWNGRSWSLASRYGFPTDGFYEDFRVGSVSCTSANFCASVELRSSDVNPPFGSVVFWNGKRRSSSSIPDSYGAAEVSCTSPRSCIAVPDGISAGWARWDGTSWTVHDPAFVDVRDLTCASATLCLAVGLYDGKVVRFTGTGWVAEADLPPSTVTCTDPALCLAIGSDGVTRRFTGSRWLVAPTPPVGGSLSCARATRCVDLGFESFSVYDGRRWSTPTALNAPIQGALSCVQASFCAAADGNQLAQFNGRRWSRVTTVADRPAPLDQVSCATARSCIGVDTYDAHRFTPAGQVDRTQLGLAMEPPSTITGISCVTRTFCVATTGQRMPSDGVHVFNGSGWQTIPSDQDTFTYLEAVSCASTRFCVAVGDGDGGGVTTVFDGTSWRLSSSPHLTRVSCVSSTFCLGTGEADGRAVSSVFDGKTWSTPAAFGGTSAAAPVGVSCASTRLCVAVGADGRTAAYRKARWTGFTKVAGSGPLVAVSCNSSTTCLAVSSTGNVVQRRGTSWSPPRHLTGLTTPTDISCPTSKACVVVDDTGQAVFGRL